MSNLLRRKSSPSLSCLTVCIVMMRLTAAKPGMDWEYFSMAPSIKRIFRLVGDGMYEVVILVSDFRILRMLAVLIDVYEQSQPSCPLPKTNTKEGEFDAYATGDLVVPHPTVPGLWKIVGRLDEQIVLSNGEKVCTLASYHMAVLQLIVSFV